VNTCDITPTIDRETCTSELRSIGNKLDALCSPDGLQSSVSFSLINEHYCELVLWKLSSQQGRRKTIVSVWRTKSLHWNEKNDTSSASSSHQTRCIRQQTPVPLREGCQHLQMDSFSLDCQTSIYHPKQLEFSRQFKSRRCIGNLIVVRRGFSTQVVVEVNSVNLSLRS